MTAETTAQPRGGNIGAGFPRLKEEIITDRDRLQQLDLSCSTAKTIRFERYDERRNEMKIKLTSVYVDDQDKALHFYTEVLGFAKKADFSQGPFRWLTVASSEEPEGTQLQLALNNNPAAQAYQQAMFQQGQPAAMFFSDNVQADYERMKARGAEFT